MHVAASILRLRVDGTILPQMSRRWCNDVRKGTDLDPKEKLVTVLGLLHFPLLAKRYTNKKGGRAQGVINEDSTEAAR